jgi:hypothetical protein
VIHGFPPFAGLSAPPILGSAPARAGRALPRPGWRIDAAFFCALIGLMSQRTNIETILIIGAGPMVNDKAF